MFCHPLSDKDSLEITNAESGRLRLLHDQRSASKLFLISQMKRLEHSTPWSDATFFLPKSSRLENAFAAMNIFRVVKRIFPCRQSALKRVAEFTFEMWKAERESKHGSSRVIFSPNNGAIYVNICQLKGNLGACFDLMTSGDESLTISVDPSSANEKWENVINNLAFIDTAKPIRSPLRAPFSPFFPCRTYDNFVCVWASEKMRSSHKLSSPNRLDTKRTSVTQRLTHACLNWDENRLDVDLST